MKQKAIFSLMVISAFAFTSFRTTAQDSTQTFTIDNHENLIRDLTIIQTRMDNYKDLIKDWQNDEVRKKSIEDAREYYGKVRGAMNGLIAKYTTLIENERPKKIKLESIKEEFRTLQMEYNSFVNFYKEHKQPKPSFAVTTTLIDFAVSFIKTVWEFAEGRLNKLRGKYKDQVNRCAIGPWDAQSGVADNPRLKTEGSKPDSIKKAATKNRGE